MAKLPRVIQKQFGIAGPLGDFGVFGSKQNGPQTFTQDPTLIQSLAAFQEGWGSSIIGNYEPPMEDMNSLFLLAFRQLAYIFQEGVPEWEISTIYFTGTLVKLNGVMYRSLVDNNTGLNPSTNTGQWEKGIGGVNGGIPTGTILPWGGDPSIIPSGYLFGNGSAVSRTLYPELFNVFGVRYGVGDGSTTFNLPNGRGKTLIGTDGTTEFLNIGQVGGEKTHVLTIPEMPAHSHSIDPHYMSYAQGDQTHGWRNDELGFGAAQNNGSTVQGGSGAHNNLQPYQVIGGIIIKY